MQSQRNRQVGAAVQDLMDGGIGRGRIETKYIGFPGVELSRRVEVDFQVAFVRGPAPSDPR